MTSRSLLLISVLFLAACTSRPAEPVVALPADASALAHRGEQIYRNICISCHNLDPRKDGSVGPAVANSSEALLEARLVRTSYPPGYHPKRETHQMPMYPQLAAETGSLAAYLKSFGPSATPALPTASAPSKDVK